VIVEPVRTYSEALEWFKNQERQNPIMMTRCLVEIDTAQ